MQTRLPASPETSEVFILCVAQASGLRTPLALTLKQQAGGRRDRLPLPIHANVI